jgi:hypothetical protein
MAEYTDRDKLLKELECGIRAGNYEEGYDSYTHINSIDDCVDTVKNFDTADVVEREKIDKAIKEITKLRDSTERMITEEISITNACYEQYANCFDECLRIIKQNIGD